MYGALDISTSGMIAARTRLEVSAANIANADAIMNDRGEFDPYRRRFALLAAGDGAGGLGVRVAEIGVDDAPFRKVYDPDHPFAATRTDPAADLVEGYVNYPNVNPTVEMVNALEATRAYEANVASAQATKSMFDAALQLIA
ncbi:MAG: flagellar basal body rod protein FlgC [Planctomycetota bacterium]|nr:MAG: flagellar basal body rod protein FlgC [Planctomycetota bacterium]